MRIVNAGGPRFRLESPRGRENVYTMKNAAEFHLPPRDCINSTRDT